MSKHPPFKLFAVAVSVQTVGALVLGALAIVSPTQRAVLASCSCFYFPTIFVVLAVGAFGPYSVSIWPIIIGVPLGILLYSYAFACAWSYLSTVRIQQERVRFQLIFPTVYLLIGGVLFLSCFFSMFHSIWCQRFLDSMFPAHQLAESLLYSLASRGFVAVGSAEWRGLQNLTVPVPFVMTVAQYYLIGLVVDKLIIRRE